MATKTGKQARKTVSQSPLRVPESGAETNIHRLARKGVKAEFIKCVKKEGKEVLSAKDGDYEQTPLHISAEEGKEEIVYLLVDKYKVDINAVDKNGWTPLHSAAKHAHINIMEFLINHGAFVRALTNEGSSPLHYFVRNQISDPSTCHRIITLLIQRGAEVNGQNKYGMAPIHQAAMRGRELCLLSLLNHNADVNILTKFNESALHFAVRAEHVASVRILLNMGADATIEAPKLGTALELASSHVFSSIRNMIKAKLSGKEVFDESNGEDDSPQPLNPSSSSSAAPPSISVSTSSASDPATAAAAKGKASGSPLQKTLLRTISQEENEYAESGSDSDDPQSEPLLHRIEKLKQKAAEHGTTFDELDSLKDKSKKTKVSMLIEGYERKVSTDHNPSPSRPRKNTIDVALPFPTHANDGDHPPDLDDRIERIKRSSLPPSEFEQAVPSTSSSKNDGSPNNSLSAEQAGFSSSSSSSSSSAGAPTSSAQKVKKRDISPIDCSELKNDVNKSHLSRGWQCKACYDIHKSVPVVYFWRGPHDWEELVEHSKETRARLSSDLCTIDNSRFYVRGLIHIPIIPTEPEASSGEPKASPHMKRELVLGVWLQVLATDFYKILSNWNKSDVNDVLEGTLNSNIQFYKKTTLNTKCRLLTRPNGSRPTVEIMAPHSLQDDMKTGISIDRLDEILSAIIAAGDLSPEDSKPDPQKMKAKRRGNDDEIKQSSS